MDIEGLRTFLMLSETGNYTKTADRMFIAQSTVTNRINELERELKVRLFKRNNRSVELTMEGEGFRIYAKKVIDLTETSLAELTSLRRFKNHIRIGSADSIYEGYLAPMIMDYRKKHPEDSLKISIGLSNDLTDQLQGGLLDIVFTYLPLNRAGYSCEVFKETKLVLVTDPDNRKYAEGITREELISESYLMCNFALQDVGEYIRKLFPRFHQFELEIDDCMKIVPYLKGCENYTFLPGNMVEAYIEDGGLREVKLKDFSPPVINSYKIFRKSEREILESVFDSNR